MENNLKEQLKAIYEIVKCSKTRSCWERGVRESALTMLDDTVTMLDDTASRIEKWDDLEKLLLNGASDWHEYSYGGNALIYDSQIAEALWQSLRLIRRAFAELTQCYK